MTRTRTQTAAVLWMAFCTIPWLANSSAQAASAPAPAPKAPVAVAEPAFWAGFDRLYPETFIDYFRQISEFEPTRAAQYGIRHFCWVAVNPKEAENPGLTRAGQRRLRAADVRRVHHLPVQLEGALALLAGRLDGLDRCGTRDRDLS